MVKAQREMKYISKVHISKIEKKKCQFCKRLPSQRRPIMILNEGEWIVCFSCLLYLLKDGVTKKDDV